MRLIDGRAAIAAALRARSNHDGIKNRDASPACQIKTVLFRASLGRQVFCRASAGGDFVHVFFFDMKGEQCLLKLQSYDEDAFELEIKDE